MTPALSQKKVQAALALHQAGRLDEAFALYRRIMAEAPRNFDAAHLAGVVALQQGRAATAAELLARAHALAPDQAVCAMRLALALSALGRHAEAETRLRKLLRRAPDWHEAWDNLGSILQLQGRVDEAIACYRRAVQLQPGFAGGWSNLGLALLFTGRAQEALECQDRARAIDPSRAQADHGRGLALQHLHRIPEAVAAYGAAIAKAPGNFATRSYRLMALHYLDGMTREELLAEHRAFGAAVAPEAGAISVDRSAVNPAEPDRRLRVGFLSPDLRCHSVAYFIEPLLRHLDPAAFELYLYHDHFVVDATSERLRGLAAVWRNLAGRPAPEAEALIRADSPDILVDLAGHTGLNRLPLFARRLAPVQVTYLGYPDTTGVAAMDYRFVDGVTDPLGEADRFCTEKLVRFAPTAWAYAPPADAPAPAPREEGPIRFGCCNNLAKVSGPTLRAWADLLQAVPDARLSLKAAGLGESGVGGWMRQRLLDAGIDPSRVEFLGHTATTADHLRGYRRFDVALDTYPYHGTTTTCEALWMGAPVVTLAGDRHAARVGASLLTAVGHPEWAARDWSEYVAIAAGLARQRIESPGEPGALRAAMARSALLDHAGQAARFGTALRRCWQAAIEVPARAVA